MKLRKRLRIAASTTVEKDTLGGVVFLLLIFSELKRGDPDHPALLVAPYLGQHRESGGRLFTRLREVSGRNYGYYVS